MMDKLAERFADLATQFGPHVLDAARAAAQTEALSCLMASLIWFAAAAALARAALYPWRIQCRDPADNGPCRVGAGVMFGIALVCCLAGTWDVIDPWTWTALSHPDLWIAKRVLRL